MGFKKPIIALFAVLVLIGSLFLSGCTTKFTQEEVDVFVWDAVNTKATELNEDINGLNTQIGNLQTALESRPTQADIEGLDEQIGDLENDVTTKDETIGELELQLAEIEELENLEEEQQQIEESRYVIDGLMLGAAVPDEDISDRELEKLFDGELEFDGDDYEAEEVFSLIGLEIATNKEDYNGDAFLTVPIEGLKYEFIVEAGLDTGDITEDETLKFSLLGKDVVASEWTEDSVTFTQGIEYFVAEGITIESGEHTIFVRIIGEDYVYVVVDGASTGEKIDDGDTEEVGGIEIEATEILFVNDGTSYVTLTIGDEVSYKIEDGDEYESNSIWEWIVTDHTIGLVLTEEFMDLDEDEEYTALDVDNTVCLPNDFICIRYDGVIEEDTEDYKFDLTTRNSVDYVRVRGDFQFGLEDYNKIYINNTGIYDEDFELIDLTTVDLDDTELQLVKTNTTLMIDDIEFSLDLDYIKVGEDDISGFDEDYLTNYGVLIQNPDDATEDNKFEFVVPEEELEAGLSAI